MEKLGPGGDVHTLHVLRLLPKQQFDIVVDAGCGTYTIPTEAWVESYYEVLEPRARALMDHPDSSVRDLAVDTIKEIEIFECSEDSYGYVFYVLGIAA